MTRTSSSSVILVGLTLILRNRIAISADSTPQKVTLQMERFEQTAGKDDFADATSLRVRKFNRTAYVLNGTFDLYADIDRSYEIGIKFAYSSLGNNQFNEYPVRLPRKNFCDVLVEEYVEYQFIWGNRTSMPRIEKGTKEFCPFPKGLYWIKELTPDAGFIPPFVPTGLWRMTWEFWLGKERLVAAGQFYYRVTKGLF